MQGERILRRLYGSEAVPLRLRPRDTRERNRQQQQCQKPEFHGEVSCVSLSRFLRLVLHRTVEQNLRAMKRTLLTTLLGILLGICGTVAYLHVTAPSGIHLPPGYEDAKPVK